MKTRMPATHKDNTASVMHMRKTRQQPGCMFTYTYIYLFI